MRTAIAIAGGLGFVAFVAGCSLLVDAGGLSTASESPSPDGSSNVVDDAAAADAPSTHDATTFVPEDAGSDTGSSEPSCPSTAGPAMTRITDSAGTFCVDKTEVTNRHLNAFIASSARPTPPSACSFKTTYGGAVRPDDDLPAANVDWCDAWMYCKWAGKRLCGSRDGTPINDTPPANNATVSEWFAACSHSGLKQYPYGGSFVGTACNGCQRTGACGDAGGSPLVAVGSLATCEGGYSGIFDMSGNVSEWEDNCDSSDTCPPRGGTAAVGGADLTCAMGTLPNISKRNQKGDRVGIRCCAD